MNKSFAIVSFLFLLFFSVATHAGTTGKIKGKVTDTKTGEPVIGANIILVGTQYGAATDIDGLYYIINVPPGSYDIKVSYIGYSSLRVVGVEVSTDRTTIQDFSIQPQEIETGEVVVLSSRPPVEKDRTSSASYVTSSEISQLPVQELSDVLQLQTGMVRDASGSFHMRGGRAGEIAYLVDGVSVTDQYRGGSSIGFENNWVQELQVISGTFNAEYGQAQSGVVNIVTKEGAKNFSGNVSLAVADHVSSHDDTFMNIDKIDLGEIDASFNLNGPVPFIPNTSFYSSLRYNNSDGWLYGKRIARIEDTVPIQAYIQEAQKNMTNEERLVGIKIPDSLLTGDNSYVAMNPDEKYSFYGKISTRLTQNLKLNYSIFYNDEERKSYSDYRRYSPDGIRTLFVKSYNNILNFTHVLSNSSYYVLNLSYYSKNQQNYLFNDPLNSRYQGSPYAIEGFALGGTDNSRSDITNASLSAKLDFTSQVDNYNQLKAGIEFKQHQLKYNTSTTISDGPVYKPAELRVPAENTNGKNIYENNPLEFSAYVQDKLELDELIVNGGLRFDYWNPNAKIPVDLKAATDANDGIRLDTDFMDSKTTFQVSPRIGLAYPISLNGVVHASYGHFFQLPKFSAIFTNSEFEVELGGLQTVMGNANLKPEKTIAYEIGLQQQVGALFGLDLTFYYKDIKNLLSQEIINTIDKKVYARYTNRDYGNVKGITLSLKTDRIGLAAGSIDYTYQVARGNASDPNAVFVDFQSNPPAESEKQVLPLDWDQTHTLNMTVNFGVPSDWNVGIIGRFATGQPYTPTNPTSQLSTQFENSDRKPSVYNIDLTIYKMLELAGQKIKLFCKIFNLTDALNERYVYSSTGNASFPYRSYEERKIIEQNPNFTLNEIDLRPDYYTEPRRVLVGFSLEF